MSESTLVILPHATLADAAADLARIGQASEHALEAGVGITIVRTDEDAALVTVYPDTRLGAGRVVTMTTTEWIGAI